MSETFPNALGQRISAPLLGFTGSRFPKPRGLVGQYTRLEPLDTLAHAEPLYEQLRGESQLWRWTYLDYGPFPTLQHWTAWLSSLAADSAASPFVICTKMGTSPLGLVAYTAVAPTSGALNLDHIHYCAPLRRSRVGTEAAYLLLANAFDELGFRRCGLRCDALDERTQRWAQRIGLRFEGTLRQDRVSKGRNRDTALYSLIDSEWPDLERTLARWLQPDNFSAQGVQLSRLSETTAQSGSQPSPPPTERCWETR